MKRILFFTALVLAVSLKAQPNIIFILADDMGYGDVQALNAKSKIPTPHLNRLAKEGMTFTDAHSPSGVCTPTRYGVLTGRYCWRSRLKRGVLGGYSAPLIEKNRPTIGSVLQSRGYHTAAIGKWHLGITMTRREGDKPAHDRWDGDGNHALAAARFVCIGNRFLSCGLPPPGGGLSVQRVPEVRSRNPLKSTHLQSLTLDAPEHVRAPRPSSTWPRARGVQHQN